MCVAITPGDAVGFENNIGFNAELVERMKQFINRELALYKRRFQIDNIGVSNITQIKREYEKRGWIVHPQATEVGVFLVFEESSN